MGGIWGVERPALPMHIATDGKNGGEGVSKVNVGLRLGEPSLTYPQAERSDSETRDLGIGPPFL